MRANGCIHSSKLLSLHFFAYLSSYNSFFFNVYNFRTACWCGNQYPSKKFKLNDSKCDVLCSGDKTKNCGGFWRLSIYSTGIVG